MKEKHKRRNGVMCLNKLPCAGELKRILLTVALRRTTILSGLEDLRRSAAVCLLPLLSKMESLILVPSK